MHLKKENIETIRFNITSDMVNQLIKFNTLKNKHNELLKKYNINKNNRVLLQILKTEEDMNKLRIKFILGFRKNNNEQIKEYLKYKDY